MAANNLYKIKVLMPADYQTWFEKIKNFLEEYSKTCPQAQLKNYQTEDWEKSQSSLLKVMYLEKRFDKGIVTIAIDSQQNVIAFAGSYEINSDIVYLAARACVLPAYESDHIISTYLIPYQQKYFCNKYLYGCVSFNTDDYSRRVMEAFSKRDKWTAGKVLRHNGIQYYPFHFIKDQTFFLNNCQQLVAYCAFSAVQSREGFVSKFRQ